MEQFVTSKVLCGAVCLGLLISGPTNLGCAGKKKNKAIPVPEADRAEINKDIVETSYNAQINNGIRRDRTIYPYHFISNEADLNDLGRDQIDALTSDIVKRPIRVNVPRFENDEELHEARVAVVRNRLVENGITEDRINIHDELSGGPGQVTAVFVGSLNDTEDDKTMWFYDSRNGASNKPGSGGNSNSGNNGNSGGDGQKNYSR